MADLELIALLKQGAREWNDARARCGLRPDLRAAKLVRADLGGANLSGADLIEANLSGANLSEARLSWANLRDANLFRADLAGAKLRGTNLSGADLHWAVLPHGELSEANLSNASLRGANLSHADLRKADLSGASLTGANLEDSDLSEANLSGANLSGANLSRANLRGANLANTYLGSTLLTDVQLDCVGGLESVIHLGPSSIGVDTLYRSGGSISEFFLRGCGVPDELIAYLPSLVGTALNYYSCFISYSTQDGAFARRLYDRLRGDRLRVWFAPEDLKGGDKLHEQIDRAIEVQDRLLLVVSEASLASHWVRREVRRAREKEQRRGTRVLFPIRLTSFDSLDQMSDASLAEELREYFIPDFSEWKVHDKFEASATRLIRDLRE